MTTSLKSLSIAAVLGTALMVSACGETTAQRVATGAAIGAGLGVGGAALMADSLWTGAIIGASAGGLAGAVTPPNCQWGDYWCW